MIVIILIIFINLHGYIKFYNSMRFLFSWIIEETEVKNLYFELSSIMGVKNLYLKLLSIIKVKDFLLWSVK